MTHKPFNLYKRPTTRKGKNVYYVRFYDETDKRLTAKSTGQTSKSAAEAWAFEQLKQGLINIKKNITFGQYVQNWLIWDKCQYVKGKLARGSSLSRTYSDSMKSYLKNHILPVFGNTKLQKITTKMIETWLMELREKQGRLGDPLTHKTVNHCLKCLKVMLKEAKRLGYININPANEVGRLSEKPKERAILSADEVKEFFLDENIERIWGGDLFHYTLNLLSASIGMRMRECQALQIQNAHMGYLAVIYNWEGRYGLKEPKWNSKRDIPIPSKTSAYLNDLIRYSPFKVPEDLVFFWKR